MIKRVFISDCEGPISKNDNAFELTERYVPFGGKVFSVVSKYDDIEADVVKRKDYNAGDTLKLILPILKAFEVTNKNMEEFSSKTLRLVPGSQITLTAVQSAGPSYIVSTSYEPYIRSLCKKTGFPFENTYSTRLNLDNYSLVADEKIELQSIAREIAEMPVMEIPDSNLFEDFSQPDRKNIERLDQIFWEHISKIEIGRVLREVKPVGGREKAKAVQDIARKTGVNLSDVMYVGDSITDKQAFELVKEERGLTISFNGNNYAVDAAEIGIISPNTGPITSLATRFLKYGKDKILEDLKETPIITRLTKENRKPFSELSSKFRKTVRGEAIGQLG